MKYVKSKGCIERFLSIAELQGKKFKKIRICLCVFVVLVIGYAAIVLSSCRNKDEGVNIILISIDCLRADHLGCYGYERNTTPNIDKLAKRGTIFSNAIASSSWTLPSHMSMMTSLYPSVHGVNNPRTKIDDLRITLAEVLKRNGYTNAGIVTHDFVASKYGFDKGFDYYEDEKYLWSRAREVTTEAIDLLKRLRVEKKFFLFLHYYDPHHTYSPPPPFNKMFNPDYQGDMVGKDTTEERLVWSPIAKEDLEKVIALYDGEIRYTDYHLGRFFQSLKDLGLDRNTVIIITSDHGEGFKEHGLMIHGNSLYDELMKIPLIIVSPLGREPVFQMRLVDYPVSHIDFAPTILGMAGIDSEREFQGENIIESFKERMGLSEKNRKVYCELLPFKEKTESTFSGIKSVRDKKFKLIRSAVKLDKSATTTDPLIRNSEQGNERYELYDIEIDQGETVNLIHSDKHLNIERTFKHDLLKWIEDADQVKRQLPWSAAKTREVELDKSTKERLRILGYIQ